MLLVLPFQVWPGLQHHFIHGDWGDQPVLHQRDASWGQWHYYFTAVFYSHKYNSMCEFSLALTAKIMDGLNVEIKLPHRDKNKEVT